MSRYQTLFSSNALCIAGLLAMPALLFNSSTIFRSALFLFFWFLCILSLKKTNPPITILIILGVIFINLLAPYGRVLLHIGAFKVTLGALMTGIKRAVTLEGLIMLSKLAIRSDLKLPGRFGSLLSESFVFFALITDSKKRITRKNFFTDLDNLLLDLSRWEGESFSAAIPLAAVPGAVKKTTPPGFFILITALIICWLFWAAPYLLKSSLINL